MTLYKYVFPPTNKHPTLISIGLIQPWGAIMPLSELQCRWAARSLSGKVGARRWRRRIPCAATAHSAGWAACARAPGRRGPLQLKLPSEAAMLKDVQAKKDEMSKRYIKSLRHTVQVDYVDYADELADLVGCRPKFWPIFFKDPTVRPAWAARRGPTAG